MDFSTAVGALRSTAVGRIFYPTLEVMNVFSKLIAISCITIGSLVAASAGHAQEAPDVLIKRVSQEVMAIAKNDREIQSGNFSRIVAVVEDKILPHLDMERATALAVGHHWRNATREQRRQLVTQYQALLMHTYARAMSQIRDQTLEFKPLRAAPGDTEVEVRSEVRMPQRPEPVEVRYRLWRSPEGWKIYDVSVLGAWLGQTYRGSFASEINRSGIDGLIAVLAERNRQLAAST